MTAYEWRISDWSSDVWSSDLLVARDPVHRRHLRRERTGQRRHPVRRPGDLVRPRGRFGDADDHQQRRWIGDRDHRAAVAGQLRRGRAARRPRAMRSEEHTSELQSLMRSSYAVFCLKKKRKPESKYDNTKITYMRH